MLKRNWGNMRENGTITEKENQENEKMGPFKDNLLFYPLDLIVAEKQNVGFLNMC